MPDWIPLAWLLHHGEYLNIRRARTVSPTAEEARGGVQELEIVLAYCVLPDCKKDFVFTRHRYPGGWGPAHRVQDAAIKAQYRRRCKLAPEADIVQGSQDQHPYLQVKRVAGR